MEGQIRTCDKTQGFYSYLLFVFVLSDAKRDKAQFLLPQGWAGHSIISADQGLSSQSPHQDARENGLQTAGLL